MVKYFTLITIMIILESCSTNNPNVNNVNDSEECVAEFDSLTQVLKINNVNPIAFKNYFVNNKIKLNFFTKNDSLKLLEINQKITNGEYFFSEAQIKSKSKLEYHGYGEGKVCWFTFKFAPNWNIFQKVYYKIFYRKDFSNYIIKISYITEDARANIIHINYKKARDKIKVNQDALH